MTKTRSRNAQTEDHSRSSVRALGPLGVACSILVAAAVAFAGVAITLRVTVLQANDTVPQVPYLLKFDYGNEAPPVSDADMVVEVARTTEGLAIIRYEALLTESEPATGALKTATVSVPWDERTVGVALSTGPGQFIDPRIFENLPMYLIDTDAAWDAGAEENTERRLAIAALVDAPLQISTVRPREGEDGGSPFHQVEAVDVWVFEWAPPPVTIADAVSATLRVCNSCVVDESSIGVSAEVFDKDFGYEADLDLGREAPVTIAIARDDLTLAVGIWNFFASQAAAILLAVVLGASGIVVAGARSRS